MGLADWHQADLQRDLFDLALDVVFGLLFLKHVDSITGCAPLGDGCNTQADRENSGGCGDNELGVEILIRVEHGSFQIGA